ncbi:MAG: hypothetical protein AB8E15_05025 [Bdellovibrionales bacterium]
MKQILLGMLFSIFAFHLQAQTNTINNYEELQSAEVMDFNLEKFSKFPHNNPNYQPPRKPIPYPPEFEPKKRPKKKVTCFAENPNGRQYAAIGRSAGATQKRAVRNCQKSSYYNRSCYPTGCRRIR